MKTIIVATDYSPQAGNAVNYAAAFAKYANASLVLFNAFEYSIHVSNARASASLVDEAIAFNQQHLKQEAERVSKTYGIAVKTIVRTAFFKEELNYQVKHLNASLVVMAMSGVFSSNGAENPTISVMRQAKYPVLAIPEKVSFKPLSTILFACDPGCIHMADKLALLKDLATLFKAKIEIYHVETNPKAFAPVTESIKMGSIEAMLNDTNHSYKEVVSAGLVTHKLGEEISNINADILVMVPHKPGFWESLMHRSATGKMINQSPVPLLALPGNEAA